MHTFCRPYTGVPSLLVLAFFVGPLAPTFTAGQVVESTGFEADPADGGWELGWMCGSTFTSCPVDTGVREACEDTCCVSNPNPNNGWHESSYSGKLSCVEPHIDAVNPASGQQHLRFSYDPRACNPPGHVHCFYRAITPSAGGPLPIGPTTISFNIAQEATSGSPPWGSTFLYWGIADGGFGGGQRIYFGFYGVAYFYDYGFARYLRMGYTSGLGVYDSVSVLMDPCNDAVTYTFNGAEFHQSAGMWGMDGWISRAILQHDNSGFAWDFDDYSVVRGDPCPKTCGADGVEVGEECDHGPGEDANCPGKCIAPGEEAECMCARDADTCDTATEVTNGTNGPFLTHGGFFRYTADTEYTGIHTCDSDFNTEIRWGFDADCQSFDYKNNQCFGSFPNTDPAAPCYNARSVLASCLNVPTEPGTEYIFAVGAWSVIAPTPAGTEIYFTITKKTGPGEPIPNGACCDGETGMCTDGVAVEDCACEQCEWFENKLCDHVEPCPTGACCDRAPGLGGVCIDGVYGEVCRGAQQTYYPGEFCDEITCQEASGACCDGLTGSCFVGLQAQCVCTQCTWVKGIDCGQANCTPGQGACCDHDDGGCVSTTMAQCDCEKCEWTKGLDCSAVECEANFTPIPTVSEWGLAVLALLLLAGGKVYFRGRRVGPSGPPG